MMRLCRFHPLLVNSHFFLLLTFFYTDKSVQYTLQSVIYHHGKSATAGHFTTAVRRGDGTWIGISDDEIFGLVIGDVVRESEGKQAYMLFYGR